MTRTRNVRIQVWLSPSEAKILNKNVRKCKLKREVYIRQLITGYAPVVPPPADYYSLIEQLYYVGINLNQIAKKAHILNVIDVQRYDEAVTKYYEILNELTDSIITPRKIE